MNLSTYLTETGTTIPDFAKQIGRSISTVYRLRSGQTVPDRETANAIFAATNGAVTPNDFFDLAPPQKGAPKSQPLNDLKTSNASSRKSSRSLKASLAKTEVRS